ncbi:MAG: c-type cytochrome [Burkholderiales bacterium]|nr:c-type cytochrome [Burkholderiales bacterium]
MKKFLIAAVAAAGVLAGANAGAAVDAAKAKQLATKYNCMACHAEDKKLVGPAFKEVAKKYKSDAGAAPKLAGKVKGGGGGVWGSIPMPPNNVPEGDIKTMVEWILSM